MSQDDKGPVAVAVAVEPTIQEIAQGLRERALRGNLSDIARENQRLHTALRLLNRAHARTLKRLRDKAVDYAILRDAAGRVVVEERDGTLVDLVQAIAVLERAARLGPKPPRVLPAPAEATPDGLRPDAGVAR